MATVIEYNDRHCIHATGQTHDESELPLSESQRADLAAGKSVEIYDEETREYWYYRSEQ